MKKITSGILAVMMLLVSLVNIVSVSPVYASTDYKVEWTEDDFMYSSEGNIIAFSDKGLEKKEKTNILVFPEGTKSIIQTMNLDIKENLDVANIGIK